MKKNYCVQKIILIFSLFLCSFPVFSQKRRSAGAENEVNRFVYTVTGVKLSSNVVYYENLPPLVALIYARTVWMDDGSPSRLIDKVLPDFSGCFDIAESLVLSLDSGDWVKEIFKNNPDAYKVTRPLEYQKTMKDLEKEGEGEKTGGNEASAKETLSSCESDSENGNLSSDNSAPASLPALQETGDEEDSLLSSGKLSSIQADSPERRLKNSENMLRLHSFEKEFISFESNDTERTIVISDGKKMFRKFFDSSLRICKKEEWKPGNSIASISLLNTEYYTYSNPDTVLPSSKKVVSPDNEKIFTFDEKSRVTKIMYFAYPENYKEGSGKTAGAAGKTSDSAVNPSGNSSGNLSGNTDNQNSKKPYLLLWETSFSYTKSGKLTEKEYISFEYSDEKYGKIVSKEEKKENWFYRIENAEPDYYYYEDEILCLKTEHSSSNDWITTMYFGNGFTVENHWKGGKQIKDLYFYNGKLQRRKNYEE